MKDPMLLLLDLDGTLIKSYIQPAATIENDPRRTGAIENNPPFQRPYSHVELLPGRAKCIDRVRANGNHVAIITNQDGVGMGYQMEEDFAKKIQAVAKQLGYDAVYLHDGRSSWPNPESDELHVFVCYNTQHSPNPHYQDTSRRKPEPGMIYEAKKIFGFQAEESTSIVYVGDRNEDRIAARRAGVIFHWDYEFFEETP
jgi:histidinol-phosphate phosphatase family protein